MRRRLGGHRYVYGIGIGWLLAEVLLSGVFRFLAGQLVLRRPDRWDSRYRTWAMPAPEHVKLDPTQQVPRTRWARRPGYQRQAIRMAWLLALVGLLVAPALTWLLILVALAVWVARRVRAVRAQRRYGAVVAPWAPFVAEKIGREGADPLTWITFPNDHVVWEQVEPLVWLTRERGVLARRAPRLARLLGALALPVAEREWVGRVREAASAQDAPASARALGAAVAALVRAVEGSRRFRVWPRWEAIPLDHDDARIVLRVPPEYPAHDEDVRVIKGVVSERLPGDWEVEKHARDLALEFRRPRHMPSDVVMGREEFARHSAMVLPIGGNAHGVVTIPLKAKTPHVSLAASTGWGKTTSANVAGAHLAYWGWNGTILDPKRVGFVGAFRNASPHVVIRTTLEGQIRAIRDFLAEMNRRYTLIEQWMDRVDELGLPPMRDYPELYFQPCFLLEDEKGSLTVAIKAWWKREGGGRKIPDLDGGTEVISWMDALGSDEGTPIPGKGDPEPLIMQQEILWRGRAAAMHVLTLAQQNNLHVFLNSDMRDQYMFRVLSGPQTQSSWIMTFPGARKRRVVAKKGRAVYGVGPEELHEVQLGAISDDEARACAGIGAETADDDNRKRAERLAQVTGRPLWAVSPVPSWGHSPAETTRDVPGQPDQGDTPAPALRPVPTPSPAGTQKTAGQNHEHGSDEPPATDHDDVADVIEEPDDPELVDAVSSAPESNMRSTPTAPTGPSGAPLVVGIDAAAERCGLKRDTFVQRRKRSRKDGGAGIPSETRVGNQPAWDPVELDEWNALFRQAS